MKKKTETDLDNSTASSSTTDPEPEQKRAIPLCERTTNLETMFHLWPNRIFLSIGTQAHQSY